MSDSSDYSEEEETQQFSIREIQARRRNATLAGKDKRQKEARSDVVYEKPKVDNHIGGKKKSKKPMEFSNRHANAGTRKAVKSNTVRNFYLWLGN